MKLERKKGLAERLMMRPLSNEVREQIERILGDIRREQQYLLDDNGHRDFLVEYIENSDAGCSCGDLGCPLDEGKVPSPVFRASGEWEEKLREWRHDHAGDAAALVEARNEYRTLRSEVERAYTKIIALARDDLDETIDVDDLSRV